MPTAFITGIGGMDGSHLSELLLDKGYHVHGGIRRNSHSPPTTRLNHLLSHPNLHLHYIDLTDYGCLSRLITSISPDEIYNLGAMSHVKISFEMPEYTAQTDGIAVLNLLEIVRTHPHPIRFYHASTSEMFGGVEDGAVLNENSPFSPKSPYAVAKLFAYHMCKVYRESYNLFICSGILFNHTSSRRGHNFVEMKIVRGVLDIKYHKHSTLTLGNLYAKRDIGHATDYVDGIYKIISHTTPDDFVLATGKSISVKHIVEMAVKTVLGEGVMWVGEGVDEVGMVGGVIRITVDKRYFRPLEVHNLVGDNSKARKVLGWEAQIPLEEIIYEMMRGIEDEYL